MVLQALINRMFSWGVPTVIRNVFSQPESDERFLTTISRDKS